MDSSQNRLSTGRGQGEGRSWGGWEVGALGTYLGFCDPEEGADSGRGGPAMRPQVLFPCWSRKAVEGGEDSSLLPLGEAGTMLS